MTGTTPEIDIDTLARSDADNSVVIDVREPAEYAAGHVPHARLMPMSRLGSRLNEIDKEAPVYVICATGNRSLAMTDLLRVNGFEAFSVAGGTAAWSNAGHPVKGGLR